MLCRLLLLFFDSLSNFYILFFLSFISIQFFFFWISLLIFSRKFSLIFYSMYNLHAYIYARFTDSTQFIWFFYIQFPLLILVSLFFGGICLLFNPKKAHGRNTSLGTYKWFDAWIKLLDFLILFFLFYRSSNWRRQRLKKVSVKVLTL